MSSTSNLTAGVERVLTALKERRLAGLRNSPFELLLEILLEDEGVATEILRQSKVVHFTSSKTLTVEAESDDFVGHFPEWQRNLIRRADQFARLANSNEPTGTEHLLLAMMDLDSSTATKLARFGLTTASLLDQITVPDPEFAGPEQALVQIQPANSGTIDEIGLSRILDASANRAREGLRVVEDYVRFRLDDPLLSRELKAIRHLLTETLRHLGQSAWISSRDTLHDVGTLGTLASERQRGSLTDVLRANLKRVEEALRTLEEYGKLLDSQLSLQLSECRYRMYTVEKTLETTIQSRQRLIDCQLYLLVTAAECRYGAEATIRHSLEKGVDIVQIREKHMSDRELVSYAEKVRAWTAETGALLIMNDRPDLAAAVGADGVHLGQDDLGIQSARQILGKTALIGISTHTPEQARQAVFEGADYLGAGPVFPSKTKAFTDFPGLPFIEHVAQNICLPWFAIGGINADNLWEVLRAGGTRIAVSSVICQAPHPRGVAQMLKEGLSNFSAAPRSK